MAKERAKTIGGLPMQQRTALFYVHRHQTDEFGAIVQHFTGMALVRRGFCIMASRRSYARGTGVCLRLTPEGLAIVNEIEGNP